MFIYCNRMFQMTEHTQLDFFFLGEDPTSVVISGNKFICSF